MNKYLKKIRKIIRKAKIRKLPKKGNELHHIIPKSIMIYNGKEKYIWDGNWNKIVLTPEEHFEIHYLIYKFCDYFYGPSHIYTEKVLYAFNRLSNDGEHKTKEKYEDARKAHCKVLSKNNPSHNKINQRKKKRTYRERYGCEWAQDKNQKIQRKKTNLKKYGTTCPLNNTTIMKKTLETLENIYGEGITNASQSDVVKEKKKKTFKINYGVDNYSKSEEGKKFLSENMIGKRMVHLIEQDRYSYMDEDQIKNLNERWEFSGTPSYDRSKYLKECPYCKRKIDASNYKRWHGDNCKGNKRR